MEAAKQFDNLTWAHLGIVDNEWKTVCKHYVKSLKYKDLWAVCSQLNLMLHSTVDCILRFIVSTRMFSLLF